MCILVAACCHAGVVWSHVHTENVGVYACSCMWLWQPWACGGGHAGTSGWYRPMREDVWERALLVCHGADLVLHTLGVDVCTSVEVACVISRISLKML